MPVTPGADHRGEMLDLQQLATIMHIRRRRDSPLIRSAYSKAMVAVIGRSGQSDVSCAEPEPTGFDEGIIS
jgi:hypothetical protein